MRKRYWLGLCLGMLLATVASAEVIGIDNFDYANGSIGGLKGGQGWDWNYLAKTHTNGVSSWNAMWGSTNIDNGALVTWDGGATRDYGSDQNQCAFRANGLIYCTAKFTALTDMGWFGISAYDFGNERIFYGMPWTGGVLGNFGIEVKNSGTTAHASKVVMNQSYLLIVALDFDGDQVRMWIDPDGDDYDNGAADNSADVKRTYTWTNWNTSFRLASGGQVRWDNYKVATTWAEVSPKSAMNPAPAKGQENVPLSITTLSWDPARDPANPTQPNMAITTHKLYGNFANPADPNLIFMGDIPSTGNRALFILPPAIILIRDATYYWRVDEIIPDANAITGTLWSFKSLPSIPIIVSSPEDQFVDAGQNAQFTVTAANPFEGHTANVSYLWYAAATNTALTNGDQFSGVNTASLTVLDAQIADEAAFFCRITNTYGNVATADTAAARLVVKRLLNHWPLDTDPNDIVGGRNGTLVGTPALVAGKVDGAYEFASAQYIKLPLFDRPDRFTVTAWAKTTMGGERHIWAWTSDIATPIYTGQRAMLFRINDGSVQYGENGIAPVGWLAVTGAGGLNDGAFQFVVITYDRGAVKLYSNGLQTGSGSTADSLPMTATQVSIANMGDRDPSAHSFNGTVDDVRFFNYPLDRYEVADLYLTVAGGSICMDGYPAYDYNRDCVVNLSDLATFAGEWLLDNRYFVQP